MARQAQYEERTPVRVEDYLGLVRSIVSKFHRGRFVEDSELYSMGCVALVDAGRTYDPSKSKFCTWATRLITQRVINEFRRKKKESSSGEMHEVASDSGEQLPVHLIPRILMGHEATDEGKMLVGHYMEGKSLAELGKEFGMSKESVRKRISSVASAIRRKSRSLLEEFV